MFTVPLKYQMNINNKVLMVKKYQVESVEKIEPEFLEDEQVIKEDIEEASELDTIRYILK